MAENNHHAKMIRDFKKRFFISTGLTLPILALSPLIQSFFGFTFTFAYDQYVIFGFAVLIYFYGGWPFLKGLGREIREGSPGMMTLIGLAISVAFLYSSAVVFGLPGRLFFWELATLIDIMLLGHWIEMRSVASASSALKELSKLMPDTAIRIDENGEPKQVKIEELEKGDILLIKPGEKIPADGEVVQGESAVNESMVTGEAEPVEKEKGDEVIGGSINSEGTLRVKVSKTGEDSYLSKVIDLVKKAQQSKSKTQRLADKAAFWLTLIAISAGTLTLLAWLLAGREPVFAIERMATVMVITCPHALGLAIPLVVAVSTTLSAKNGLLIRNRTSFEGARKISILLFDKTGTLTKGEFGVTKIQVFDSGYSEKDVIRLAASLEQNSEHPIGEGILKKAKEMELDLKEVSEFQALKGKGVEAKIGDKTVRVVSPGYLKSQEIGIPEENEKVAGATQVFLMKEGKVLASIALEDEIRESSRRAVADLQKEGIKCWMVTGDNEETAKKVAEKLKLDGYKAEILPDEKQDVVKEFQKQGEFVAMTGDGVNDAPALAQADVGIAVGSGTDVAAETADIILVESDPRDVRSLILFGKATYKKMLQNLWWATGYNFFAIPLAAGALYKYGIVISPALGAVLMSLSTVIVAVNARFLKVDKKRS
jgi:Cu2+-exporting ATPase